MPMQLVFVVAIVLIVVRIAIVRAKRADEAWDGAGRRLGLDVKSGGFLGSRRMNGERGGVTVRVDTFTRRTGRSSRSYTRYSIGYEPLGLGLELKRESFFSGAKKLLGGRDIEIGDPTFDAAVDVRGSDPAAVRRFLMPRRAIVTRALERYDGIEIGDTRILFVHRGTDGEERLVGTVEALIAIARELTDGQEKVRAGGGPASRPGRVGVPAVLAAIPTIPAIPLIHGDRVEAAPIEELRAVRAAAPESEDTPAGLQELPSEPAQASDRLAESAAEACAAIFVPGRMSTAARQTFDERYAGRALRWMGELLRIETYYSDAVFGSARGARALLKIHTIGGTALGAGDVQAVVQLPLAAAEELRERIGAAFELSGRLVRCDPYMRHLFVADGALDG